VINIKALTQPVTPTTPDQRPEWITESSMELLREWWAEGHSRFVIAARLGVSPNAVWGKIRRMNLPGHPRDQKPPTPRNPPAPRRPVPPPRAAPPARQWRSGPRVKTCHFPLWGPDDPIPKPPRFCDEPAVTVVYCAAHAERCFA
jgi:hypothetical protein